MWNYQAYIHLVACLVFLILIMISAAAKHSASNFILCALFPCGSCLNWQRISSLINLMSLMQPPITPLHIKYTQGGCVEGTLIFFQQDKTKQTTLLKKSINFGNMLCSDSFPNSVM
jgi:hypothetical protein